MYKIGSLMIIFIPVIEVTVSILYFSRIFIFQVNLVAALDIYDDDEPELLLCYNRKCDVTVTSTPPPPAIFL